MNAKAPKRVLIMAGGTGGHVFPGLSVAHCLKERGVQVHWLGTPQGIESRLVPEAELPLHYITISGLRGKGIKTLLTAPFKIITSIWQAMRVIKKVNPDIVIGMGGFASGPGGIASWLLGRPLIIHEQNAKAGWTNKILSIFARKVLQGFPFAFPLHSKVLTIGNPVRSEIASLHTPENRFGHKASNFRLLVLGGSLGAKALNEIVPRVLSKIDKNKQPEVLHQTGDKLFNETKKQYESMGLSVTLQPFIKDMANAYAWADIVLCRAGALTVAELCAAGLGAIFVPYPYAVDDHQTANAHFMVKHQAAICLQQSELTEDRLIEIIQDFLHSPEKCLNMAKAAYKLRQVNVAEKIVDICWEVNL